MTEPYVDLIVNLIDGKIRCTGIEVTAAPGTFLTGTDLRQIPIAHLAAEAAARFSPPTLPPPEGFPTDGPTPEALRYIASVYALAYESGRPPTKAVEGLGLTYSTASRWVALARAAGHIGRTSRGRASA